MLIMTFLITQVQSHLSNNSRSKSCFEIKLIISVNIIEAKLFFDLTGFEPWISGSAVQYPNH